MMERSCRSISNFHYDVGYESDGAVVLGWLNAFLNSIAVAVWVRAKHAISLGHWIRVLYGSG
jgi:hypothetical protein